MYIHAYVHIHVHMHVCMHSHICSCTERIVTREFLGDYILHMCIICA